MRRRQAVIRKAMVAEGNETQSKQKAQHTKEEIKALELFLRLRFCMTSTEVSSVWRQYGTAWIAKMAQEVYEMDMATAQSHTQEEEMTTNERKQLTQSEETSTTTELKQSDKTFITI